MSTEATTYGIQEHRHRFSVWAAARAAQRGFTSIENLRDALEKCGVREYLETCDGELAVESEFEQLHRSWCREVMRVLCERAIEHTTFGRAAKLVNMYVKSVAVLGPLGESNLANIAHPPVDRILLSRLSRKYPDRTWGKTNWTQLGESEYYALIAELRPILRPEQPFWQLEQYWTITRDS